jgi:hypothetical protein
MAPELAGKMTAKAAAVAKPATKAYVTFLAGVVSQGCIVREIVPVYPPENQTQFDVINYSKLRIWEFVCSSWSTRGWCTSTLTSRCSTTSTNCSICPWGR